MKKLFPVICVLLCLIAAQSFAGSATWSLNPTSGDWNTAANWTPATVPDGLSDVATFGSSDRTTVTVSDDITVNGIVFESGANPFTITMVGSALGNTTAVIDDGGITNDSGLAQNFIAAGGNNDGSAGTIILEGDAKLSDDTIITITGPSTSAGLRGTAEFFGNSSAGDGVVICSAATVSGTLGGHATFFDSSSGGNGSLIARGGTVPDEGTQILFWDNSKLGNATLFAYAGTNGGLGGAIQMSGKAQGGIARMMIFGDGTLNDANGRFDISLHDERAPDISVGSIEGGGEIVLGRTGQNNDSNLIVGTNNLSTGFSGVIHGAGVGGTLTKTGTGGLTLYGANFHAGGTIVANGLLYVANRTGSATGSGPVTVTGGKLAGTGTIAGSVTIGTGSSSKITRVGPPNLIPGAGGTRAARLTIQSLLDFKSDGIFSWHADTKRNLGDQVTASGVTIEGAQFHLTTSANQTLTPGQVFTAINNTSGDGIDGTFANLPDGGTVIVGSNAFQANYEGGDGNDLTLTVVQ